MASGVLAPQPIEQLGFTFVPSPAPPRFWRLVRETSKRAWYVVGESLPRQEKAVYFGLMAYWNRYQDWPTSQELLEFLLALKARHPRHPRYRCINDINYVRPRLTMMNQRDPAVVITGVKRVCRSARARERNHHIAVLTWRVPQLGDPVRGGRG